MTHIKNTSSIIENIILDMDYESYFVNNYKPDLIRKAYAKSVAYDPCFEGFSNPIESISISSANDFNLDYLAGNEINSLFKHNYSDNNLANYEFNPYSVYEIDNQIIIYNVSTPSLDSIHTLYFNIYCADGKTYLDTLNNVNLNRTNNFYYY